MSTSGKYGPLELDQDGAYVGPIRFIGDNVVSCVLFKYFSVIIKKVEMILVVLNITAC